MGDVLSYKRIQGPNNLMQSCLDLDFSVIYLFIYLLFRATPVAYGSSWARGQIRAAAAGLCHSTAMPDPSHLCDLQHSSQQHRILNPLKQSQGLNPHPHGY